MERISFVATRSCFRRRGTLQFLLLRIVEPCVAQGWVGLAIRCSLGPGTRFRRSGRRRIGQTLGWCSCPQGRCTPRQRTCAQGDGENHRAFPGAGLWTSAAIDPPTNYRHTHAMQPLHLIGSRVNPALHRMPAGTANSMTWLRPFMVGHEAGHPPMAPQRPCSVAGALRAPASATALRIGRRRERL